MPEFLELLETVRAEQASVQHLFGGEGRSLRRMAGGPEYTARLAEAASLLGDVIAGRRPSYLLREAMTTSDFPLLMGDIIDRQLLANYREAPQTYRNYCKISTVSDFREVKRFTIGGAEGVLDKVEQQSEYKERKLTEAKYGFAVAKYGNVIGFSWEQLINDDLQAFQDIPQRYGRAARRSEEKFATGLFVDANGPHATLYAAGNKNQVNIANGATANNPPLSITGLQDALMVLSKMVDSDGEPIVIDAVELVVPPALEVSALNILNATELWLTTDGGDANRQVHVANWLRNRLRLNVNAYIPIVANVANGNTSWFLFANPNNGRPALEVGFLRGHTEPEIFMKDPDARQVGGDVNAQDGDFDSDTIKYKVRHVFGGGQMDPKMTVASKGTNAA